MIKLVAFDWNGTLLADIRAIIDSVNNQLKFLGKEPITLQVYREHYDIPYSKFLNSFGVTNEIIRNKSQDMAKNFHSFYEPRVARARTRSGTRTLLQHLKNKRISSIILSNHTYEGIYLQTERLGITTYFDTILANEIIGIANFTGKEHRLKSYMEEQQIAPNEVIIVGDTVEEIRIGANLGLNTVAITGGYNSKRRLIEAKPDYLINKLSELTSVLEGL